MREYKKSLFIQLLEVEKKYQYSIDLFPIIIDTKNKDNFSFCNDGFDECEFDEKNSVAKIYITNKGVLNVSVFFKLNEEYDLIILKEITLLMDLICYICKNNENDLNSAISIITKELNELNYLTELQVK
jgi:hypothetical protein